MEIKLCKNIKEFLHKDKVLFSIHMTCMLQCSAFSQAAPMAKWAIVYTASIGTDVTELLFLQTTDILRKLPREAYSQSSDFLFQNGHRQQLQRQRLSSLLFSTQIFALI